MSERQDRTAPIPAHHLRTAARLVRGKASWAQSLGTHGDSVAADFTRAADWMDKAVDELERLRHLPTVTSLGDFHVGASIAAPDVIEVRFVLTDKAEARDWAVWLFERQEANSAR